MAHAAAPPLHADDGIAALEHTEVNAVANAPFQAPINVFLPWLLAEVWLWFAKEERVDATIEMGILEKRCQFRA